ncbi:hypothetical protein SAMN05192574_10992 [Mucilaginibacter gossypiicola]|uniref:Uncharacterized protein n=1 Tax=Mucilaginibacter gossypiicola TaxID=551995 RepID=A0A1H8QPH3_9SPHI|nr:hypothetical protein [Mucilaginibacter gossypiicola]SEO56119.1 hypothetical protein SAMN05192574_10992 [Mucilaginibacter gossypiicola]
MKFVLTFSTIAFITSMIVSLFSGSGEMMGFTLFFNIGYLLVSFITWPLINLAIKSNRLIPAAIKCLLGLIILNLITYLLAGTIPTATLLGQGKPGDNITICVIAHLIYIFSFSFSLIWLGHKTENEAETP